LEALLDRAVRAPDDGVQAVVRGDATRVQASLVAIVLRLALSAALGFAGTARSRAGGLRDSFCATEAWLRAAGVRSPALVGPPSSLLDDVESVERWLDVETASSMFDMLSDGAARIDHARVSGIHEELLTLRLRRLPGAAVSLRPNGAWVVMGDVLAERPELRSKWLQRTFGLPKSAVERLASALSQARTEEQMLEALSPLCFRRRTAASHSIVVDESLDRRRSGSHYTPPALTEQVVLRALSPLVDGASSQRIRALRICDPAMGSGVFLETAAEYLAAALARAEGVAAGASPGAAALRAVVVDCLCGVDKDSVAVDLARARLASLATPPGSTPPDLSMHLKSGDALVGSVGAPLPAALLLAPGSHFDWTSEFAAVFAAGGFDACVGNPPWVAYVGRAAQPLPPELAAYYETTNPAFRAYKTLHGLFVRRAAELLRAGGRLGLVLPTSVADLDGYGPTRDAHDALCDVDQELIDFGDGAFEGVFQPCMALTSTRRGQTTSSAESPGGASARSAGRARSIWQLSRTDLDPTAAGLLLRLDALPKLAGELFGERGFQTTGDDLAHLRKLDAPEAPFVVPIHEGGDITEFRTAPPRTFLNPEGLRGRLRDPADFRAVDVLIRQTARYPIASLSDGAAFRNSVLAGFASGAWSAPAIVAYLNSSLVRFYHFTRHRDARQGMPQLKIGHLRALPDVPESAAREALHVLGQAIARKSDGICSADRQRLDELVAAAFGLTAEERFTVQRWAENNPLPTSRRERATDTRRSRRAGARP
jgi:hypothetical protein